MKAGVDRDDQRWDDWMASPTLGHEFEQALGVGDGQGRPGMLQSMGLQWVGYDLGTEQQQQQHGKGRRGGMDW